VAFCAIIEDHDEAGGVDVESDDNANKTNPFYWMVEMEVEVLSCKLRRQHLHRTIADILKK